MSTVASVQLRAATVQDSPFVVEMVRIACSLDDRPLPRSDGPTVLALLPATSDGVIVAADDAGAAIGAAWWHMHEPPMLREPDGTPLPEMAMAVSDGMRGRGVGTALIEALASEAARQHSTLSLNVHLRNPAVRLYMRTGFRVAGKGRGWFGVAMSRDLQAERGPATNRS